MDKHIRLEILTSSVHCEGTRHELTRRQVELLSLIAARTRPAPRCEIAEEMWPDNDVHEACKAFDVTLHRLRRSLAPHVVVLRTSTGYALAEHVETDIGEIERYARALHAAGPFDLHDVTELREAYKRLTRPGSWSATGRVPASVETRMRGLIADIGTRLAAHALRKGDPNEALAISDMLVTLDHADEQAWEIAIRSHLARQDRGLAIRAFRSYARCLDAELGLKPSPHMLRLIDEPQVASAGVAA
jgi:DNA-binding SARP family transcriptional activator